MHPRALRALAAHPELWPTAVVLYWRLAGRRWWRHWPPVPRPDQAYMRFRAQTAYGDGAAVPSAQELVDYLAWCRRMAVLRRRPAGAGKSVVSRRHRASVAAVSPVPPPTGPQRPGRFNGPRRPGPDRHRRSRHR